MAIGGDQGGSIRIPAAYCGIYGMKPTHGLVPYTGIMPIEIYVDHTGPMTANVTDNALLLEVIAGPDGYDPRQYQVKTESYTAQLSSDIAGLNIAVVREGFGHDNSEPDVDAKVRAAGQRLQSLGAKVEEVSIPWHTRGAALWLPIGIEGLTQTMMWGDGYGFSRSDLYVTSLMDFHRGWRQRADELSETTKLFTLLGTYIRKRHGSRYYGKAMNITRQLIAAYDQALSEYDLLMMPTLPLKSTPLPAADASREDYVARALEMITNTAPFDISHHPAMAIPCGMSDGLPISMMLVGKYFDEATIYRAAYAFEQSGDWQSM
jgi:amidase